MNEGMGEQLAALKENEEDWREEHLNLIINESVRMSEMVGDILDYSRLQSGVIDLKKEYLDVTKIIEKVKEYVKKSQNICKEEN